MNLLTAARPRSRFELQPVRTVSWLFVPVGAAGGLALGATARAWMRWISTDPEFTWTGTIAIVASSTVFAAAQSVAAVARLRAVRPSGIAACRVGAIVLSAGLFGAAGAIMLPTVMFGSLAAWRSNATRSLRLGSASLALPGVVFVLAEISRDNGWSIATIGQMLVFLCIYAVIIAAMWPSAAPVPDGWRPSRRLLLIFGCMLALLVGLALYFGGVQ